MLMRAPIRLVVGLGNPGREHEGTRHNAGFWFADALASQLAVPFAPQTRFLGLVAHSGSIRLLKPSTYMNVSGRSAAALSRFFDIATDQMLVAHDELDLEPGDARLKFGGGVAGHNGLKDLREQLGSADFWRLRLGIGHPRDSVLSQQQVVDYVLKPPTAGERRAIEDAIARSLDIWPCLAAGDFERAMTALHTRDAT
jgi:PTH1 family peptidyl-tRNA hydrolase